MEEHVKILQLLCNNPTLGILNKQSEVDLSAVVELQGAGYITVSDTFKPLDGSAPAFAAPRITIKGREYLESQLRAKPEPPKKIQPRNVVKVLWLGVASIGVVVAIWADALSILTSK